MAYPYQPEELAYLDQVKRSYVDGNPPQVKAKLEDLADLYQTTDLTIVTICHGFAERYAPTNYWPRCVSSRAASDGDPTTFAPPYPPPQGEMK